MNPAEYVQRDVTFHSGDTETLNMPFWHWRVFDALSDDLGFSQKNILDSARGCDESDSLSETLMIWLEVFVADYVEDPDKPSPQPINRDGLYD